MAKAILRIHCEERSSLCELQAKERRRKAYGTKVMALSVVCGRGTGAL